MRLTPVKRRNVVGDVVNVGAEDVFSIPKFLDEHNAWALQSGQDNPPGAQSFIQSMHGMFDRNFPDVLDLGEAQGLGAFTSLAPEVYRPIIRVVNALHALSRLIGAAGLVEDCSSWNVSGENFGDKRPSILFDVDEEMVARGAIRAYGLIIRADDCTGSETFGPLNITRGREVWYRAEGDGLYLTMTNPATYSQQLLDGLIISAGSEEAAMSVLDIPNSVTVRPYLSAAYLLNQPD